MPYAGWIDRILAGAELVRLRGSIGQLLMQCHVALDAADHLMAVRMHLPARPRLVEAVHRDDAALIEIVRVALAIALVPFEARKFGLGDGSCAHPEMNRIIEQRLALHGYTSIGAHGC